MMSTNKADLPSALYQQGSIVDRLKGRPVAFFLDYDGTLTPIAERPEDAILSDAVRKVVRRLACFCPVAIVSGRDRMVVEHLVDIKELTYVGSHGFDIAGKPGSGIRREVGLEYLPTLNEAEVVLRERLRNVSGALIERKKFSISVHFRLVTSSLVTLVEDVVDAVLEYHPMLRKAGGKAVFELRPDLNWDKGSAVLWLLDTLRLNDAFAIHIGDDLTDETVFHAIVNRGAGIIVGHEGRHTAARFGLRDPGEVEQFLDSFPAFLKREQR